MKFGDIVECIGATSPKMAKICHAINSDEPRSFRTMQSKGYIDFDDYYKYDDEIAFMMGSRDDDNVSVLHIYLSDAKKQPHTHYIISPPLEHLAFSINAQDNSMYKGEELEIREAMENISIGDLYIYDTRKTGNVLLNHGNLIGIAHYSMMRINNAPYVSMRFEPVEVKTLNNGKTFDSFKTIFPAPKYLTERVKKQSEFLKNLDEDNSIDSVKRDKEQFSKFLKWFKDRLEQNDDNDTENQLGKK